MTSDYSWLVDELLIDQRAHWLRGDYVAAESYLAEHPELSADGEAVLDLIYGEFCLAEELGRVPKDNDYLRRFPGLSDRLRVQFDVHRGMVSPELFATASTLPLETDPETCDPPAANPRYGPTLPPDGTPVDSQSVMATGGGPSAAPRFRVLRPHDKGGLGEVFLAKDQELDREVALKEIQARFADRPDSRARFLQEAEITGKLVLQR